MSIKSKKKKAKLNKINSSKTNKKLYNNDNTVVIPQTTNSFKEMAALLKVNPLSTSRIKLDIKPKPKSTSNPLIDPPTSVSISSPTPSILNMIDKKSINKWTDEEMENLRKGLPIDRTANGLRLRAHQFKINLSDNLYYQNLVKLPPDQSHIYYKECMEILRHVEKVESKEIKAPIDPLPITSQISTPVIPLTVETIIKTIVPELSPVFKSSIRFLKSSDGITDTQTNKVWVNFQSESQTIFKNINERVKGLNLVKYNGFDNWRCPTIQDLISLINFTKIDPASDFPGIMPEMFWSSTPFASSPHQYQWVVDFNIGLPSIISNQVLLNMMIVRDLPAITSFINSTKEKRFKSIVSGATLDKTTNKVWSPKHIEDRLSYERVEKLVLQFNKDESHGINTWRIPTRNEWLEIVNFDLEEKTELPGVKSNCHYWSSDLYNSEETRVCVISFRSGGTTIQPKTNNCYTRLISDNI